jgi:ABC-2 type transport system permease protein
VQTFINIIPFTVPMMYPYYLIADGERIPLRYHDIYVANPVAEAVMLIQRGFWIPTCDGPCVVDPVSGTELPEFVGDLYSRGLVMLVVGIVLLGVGQFVFSRLEKTVPERL